MSIIVKFHPCEILQNRGQVAWVLIQHVLVKGFFAAKFLVAARLLGPEQFGLVGVALAALAIVESLSDTGMSQAVIQRKKLVSQAEAGAVWTLQITRGFVLLVVLYLFAGPIGNLFGIAAAAPLIALAALLPLVRNAVNPGYAVLQRDRHFRALCASESAASLMDLVFTIVFLYAGLGAVSVLMGSLVADGCRLVLSWFVFRLPMTVNVAWGVNKELGSYGKWIWGSSVLVLMLNQFDKIMVSRLLGASQFGLYQASNRIAQLTVSEIANALSTYFFPMFASAHHRGGNEARTAFNRSIKKVGFYCGLAAISLVLIGPYFLQKTLGPQWTGMNAIIQIQSIAMWFSGMNSLCVAYLRAVGCPDAIFLAICIQLLILILPSYWVLSLFGAIGMACLMTLALSVSFFVLLYSANKVRSN